MAIRPPGGRYFHEHVVWHVPTGAPYISSLVYYDGLLYMAGDVGVITCVDAKTGTQVWRQRLGGIYTASPVRRWQGLSRERGRRDDRACQAGRRISRATNSAPARLARVSGGGSLSGRRRGVTLE
jgi:outer membrane protein assembly factor BamB